LRLFVTGASGHIGSAVVPDLLAAGLEVGRSSLDDLDGLREVASDADGVIHLAFKHELTRAGESLGPPNPT